MEVTKIKCDNPACKAIDESESDEIPTRRTKPLLPPYGWIHAPTIGPFGSGPYIKNLIVCGVPCLVPAYEYMLNLERQAGR
jgi:hypothetical protein